MCFYGHSGVMIGETLIGNVFLLGVQTKHGPHISTDLWYFFCSTTELDAVAEDTTVNPFIPLVEWVTLCIPKSYSCLIWQFSKKVSWKVSDVRWSFYNWLHLSKWKKYLRFIRHEGKQKHSVIMSHKGDQLANSMKGTGRR